MIKKWALLASELKGKDTLLAPIIEEIGLPTIKLSRNYFRSLIKYIVWQQLSPQAANSIFRQITKLSPPFPNYEFFLKTDIKVLRETGLSISKIGFIKDLSQKWNKKEWRKKWGLLPDEAIITKLCEVKGIGVWTAQMFLIFSLGRPNVLPVLDYGIRKGLKSLYGLDVIPLPREVPPLVVHWEGAYSVGCWYLWRAMEKKLLT